MLGRRGVWRLKDKKLRFIFFFVAHEPGGTLPPCDQFFQQSAQSLE
jgi:hypothetical protein